MVRRMNDSNPIAQVAHVAAPTPPSTGSRRRIVAHRRTRGGNRLTPVDTGLRQLTQVDENRDLEKRTHRVAACNAMQPHATWCNAVQPICAVGQNEPTARPAVDTGLRQLTQVDAGLPQQAVWKNEPTVAHVARKAMTKEAL